MSLFSVTVTREDGSTCTRDDVGRETARQLVSSLLTRTTPRAITIRPMREGAITADAGPILPLEEAIRWRQPDDEITRILTGRI